MHTSSEQEGNRRKGKGGRPKKATSKSAVLVVRLTPAERLSIEQKAAQAGIKVAEWFRIAAEKATVKPRFTPEEIGWLRSLAGLCNNLNQLTKLAHREGLMPVGITLRAMIKEISAYLDKLKDHGGKTD